MSARVGVLHRVTRYATDVLAGRVVVGPFVRLACERHLRDLKRWRSAPKKSLQFWFDEASATRTIDFFERELVLPDMLDDDGECMPFKLSPWQAFIVGSLFGWKKADGHRRFRTAYVETGKGSGKTPLAAGIALYCLVADGQRYPEVYSAAVSQKQASIPWTDAERMVRHAPRLKQHIDAKAHVLVGKRHGGKFEAVSREAMSLLCKRPHCAIIEELHEHPTDQVVTKMRRGTKRNKDALIVEITNAGMDRTSICWRHHEMSRKILEQSVANESWFAYVCALDDGDDFRDPAVWPKANPNIGVTIDGSYLQEAITECEGDPAAETDVRRLNFCEWVEKQSTFLQAARWHECRVTEDPDLAGITPFGAIDLGETDDMSSFALVWPLGEERYFGRVWYWAPEEALKKHKGRPWAEWRRASRLTVTDGNVTDFLRVRQDVSDIAREAGCDVIAYDKRFAQQMAQELQGEGFTMIDQPQGFALNEPTRKLGALVAEGGFLHDGDPLTTWQASNVIVIRGNRGDLRPDKEKSPEKIDGIVAEIMALGRALLEEARPDSPYENEDYGMEAVG
jgi:phage terminase large subunit-like protein